MVRKLWTQMIRRMILQSAILSAMWFPNTQLLSTDHVKGERSLGHKKLHDSDMKARDRVIPSSSQNVSTWASRHTNISLSTQSPLSPKATLKLPLVQPASSSPNSTVSYSMFSLITSSLLSIVYIQPRRRFLCFSIVFAAIFCVVSRFLNISAWPDLRKRWVFVTWADVAVSQSFRCMWIFLIFVRGEIVTLGWMGDNGMSKLMWPFVYADLEWRAMISNVRGMRRQTRGGRLWDVVGPWSLSFWQNHMCCTLQPE